MEQLLFGIYGGLLKCDDNFATIAQAFNKQNRLNKLMSITLLLTTYTVFTTYKANRIKIDALTKEIERLKSNQESVEQSVE